MKVAKKVALALLLSICITRGVNAEAHEDPAYIYAPITANERRRMVLSHAILVSR